MINSFGLYKSNVPRWKIPGLKSDRRLDDQTQDWWLPFFDENGNIHMVDTYHIELRSTKEGQTILDRIIKEATEKTDNSWLIFRANSQYYYGGSVKITEETEKYFEEVCDLRDFEISKADANDYSKKDFVDGVQLYFEYAYPNGVLLLRKNAKKDFNREVQNFIRIKERNCDFFVGQSDIKDVDEFIERIKKEDSNNKEQKERLLLLRKFIQDNINLRDKKNKMVRAYYDKAYPSAEADE